MGLPDDLVCTAADLAFLQRMKNIRHHDQLQVSLPLELTAWGTVRVVCGHLFELYMYNVQRNP